MKTVASVLCVVTALDQGRSGRRTCTESTTNSSQLFSICLSPVKLHLCFTKNLFSFRMGLSQCTVSKTIDEKDAQNVSRTLKH